jgi:VWFA-related protein
MVQRTLSLFLLSLLILPGLAVAQEQQQPAGQFGERVTVSEVLLDVLVLDKDGNVVPGLGKDDFTVTEDGKPMQLTSVDFYTTRYGGPEASATKPGEVPASRYFIFYFDDQKKNNLSTSRLMGQQLEAGRQARKWVEEAMQPSDWIAVVSYDFRLKIQQDFTQNRDDLLRAISNAVRARSPGRFPSRMKAVDASAPSLLENLPKGKALRDATTNEYKALTVLARATKGIVGRKNLILFSIGFGQIDPQTGVARPDRRYYPELKDTLNNSNVAVYPLDLTPVAFEHAQRDFLSLLAADTGARSFLQPVNFRILLDRISKENAGYYLISYRSPHPRGESGFQDVKVETKDPKLEVLARKGYHFGKT